MKCLILAAGYAKRLYPLTENFPKPLLKIKGKAILDWIVNDLDSCQKIDEYLIITNNKFYVSFEEWASLRTEKITVLNDGTDKEEERLGAVRDIEFAIKHENIFNEDILVVAGDNLLDFSLKCFFDYAESKQRSCVMRFYEKDDSKLSRTGILQVDHDDKIMDMCEKPKYPKSHWCCPPFYFFIGQDIDRVSQGLEEGCGMDSPGSYIAWLSKKVPMYAMQMPGNRYDIGTIASYEAVQANYKGIVYL